MNQSLILTVIGPDRTGLVEAVARHVTAHGGNWLESRMARLAGKFAGILRVQVPDEQVDELTSALRDLGAPQRLRGSERILLELDVVGHEPHLPWFDRPREARRRERASDQARRRTRPARTT